jgi:glycosyltransferase involved in cell wall biosynthesis
MMPLISIIIPVYNSEKYIADTIISCLNQSFTDFELIIVNDGSTDGVEKVINEFVN